MRLEEELLICRQPRGVRQQHAKRNLAPARIARQEFGRGARYWSLKLEQAAFVEHHGDRRRCDSLCQRGHIEQCAGRNFQIPTSPRIREKWGTLQIFFVHKVPKRFQRNQLVFLCYRNRRTGESASGDRLAHNGKCRRKFLILLLEAGDESWRRFQNLYARSKDYVLRGL